MPNRFALAALVIACLTLSSCAESKYPLGPLELAEQDTRVHGVWARTDESGEIQYLHVGREAEDPFDSAREEPEPGLMHFWLINHDPATGAVSKPGGFRCYRTRLGDADYANCIVPPDHHSIPAKPLRYIFYKYHVDGDTLHVWGLDFEAAGRLVEQDTLAGETERNDDGELKSVFITATTDELTAYLQQGGDQILFPESQYGTYQRQPNPPLDKK